LQNYQDTIVALSTAPGQSAIAMIRLDGQRAFEIIDCFFKGKKMSEQVSHTIHFGKIIDGESIIDEVVVANKTMTWNTHPADSMVLGGISMNALSAG
jgi:tRNA modification GTPase